MAFILDVSIQKKWMRSKVTWVKSTKSNPGEKKDVAGNENMRARTLVKKNIFFPGGVNKANRLI